MPASSRSWLVVGVLFTVVVAFWFSPVWAGGRILAPMDILHEMLLPWRGDKMDPNVHNHFVSDAVTQYVPYRMFAEESLRSDGFLGWNPYVFGGTPFYADTMATPYDWTMQLHRWLPFWSAWHFGLASQFLIAGLGMLVFLRGEGVPPPVALMGAIAFAAASPFVIWIYHRWALGAFCWMPWLLWTLQLWKRGERRLSLLAPVFIALCLIGGTIQHATFVCVALGALWVASIAENRCATLQITSWFFICGALGAALAAFSLVPAIMGFLDNVSGGYQNRGGLGYSKGSLQPVLNFLSYFAYPFPWPLGSPASLDLWKILKSDLMNVCYFGFVPTLLAFILVWRRRLPLAPRLMILAGLIIPLTPLVGPLYHRVNLLFLTGGIWLVAYALARMDTNASRRLAAWAAGFFTIFLSAWMVASALAFFLSARIEVMLKSAVSTRSGGSQFGIFSTWLEERAMRWLEAFPIWTPASLAPVLLAVAGIVCLFFWQRSKFAPWILSLVVFTEVSLSASQWVTFSDPAKFPPYPETPEVAALRSVTGSGRVSVSAGPIASSFFPPNTLIPYRIMSLQGYDSIHPRFSMGEERSDQLNGSESTHRSVNAAFLNNDSGASYAGWRTASASHGTILLTSPEPTSRYLASGPSGRSLCPVKSETPNHRVLAPPADARVILFMENWDPGWTAADDVNIPLTIERLPEGGMAVHLSAPVREIQIRYTPLWHASGIRISIGAMFLGAAIAAAVIRRNIRREHGISGSPY